MSLANLMAEYRAFVKLHDKEYESGQTFKTNKSALESAFVSSNVRPTQELALETLREARAAALYDQVDLLFISWLTKFAEFINEPFIGAAAIPVVWEYLADNNLMVTSREITRGTWSWTTSANTVPANLIQTISVDARGYPIEDAPRRDATASDFIYALRCTGDVSTGEVVGRFLLYLEGTPPWDELDDVEATETGVEIIVSDGRQGELLQNGLFSQAIQGAATNQSKVPGWWIDNNPDKVTADTASANGYRPKPNTITPENTNGLYQQLLVDFHASVQPKLIQRVRGRLDPTRPYIVGAWVKGINSADGNVTVTFGASSKEVALTSSWQFVRIDDQDSWLRNAAADPMYVTVQRTGSVTQGEMVLARVVCRPAGAYLWGRWTEILPGEAGKDFRRGDKANVTDSVGNTAPVGTNQVYWNKVTSRLGANVIQRYLPSTADATQITASGGRTLTFAVTVNTITASSGDFTADGYKVGQELTVAGTSSNNGTYTITAVTATVITVSSGIANEGPLSSTATLDASRSTNMQDYS